MKERVLIVEDQFIEANNLQMILERAGYYVCSIARSVPVALNVIQDEQPDMVLLDIFLQGPLTGIDLAKKLKEKNIPFVYLSANSNKETLDAAKATQPYGFLVKPFREKDVLVMLEIAHYLHRQQLNAAQATMSTANLQSVQQDAARNVIGKSRQLQTVIKHAGMVAASDTSVLLLGESGTGKEVIADLIHRSSNRHQHPFIKVNCGALPATLIESVLFGHEKAAFTGATEKRTGKFEQANNGTIFLDEIGDMPIDLQVKLLRVLQEREIERIGGAKPIKINLRVIAATNRNLEKEVAEGRFRMDLYYRLNVFPIYIPALRDRKEDIPMLVQHFIDKHCSRMARQQPGIADKVMDMLVQHDWPGNIRELEHIIERAILLCEGKTIEHVMLSANQQPATTATKVKTIEENEREHIVAVLNMCNGKVYGKGGAAEILGLKVSTLNSRMKKLGIEK